MKKIVKIAVIAVVVILAIALIAPAALRGKIADIVKREANAMLAARLDFEKLDISLLRHFPNASVELKGLTLVGVDRFEGDTIVAARRISVVVNLMSLFGDSGFEVTKVILASPAVHAHKLADGAVSWDVMKPAEAPAEEAPAGEPAPSSFRLSVRDFRISDAAKFFNYFTEEVPGGHGKEWYRNRTFSIERNYRKTRRYNDGNSPAKRKKEARL